MLLLSLFSIVTYSTLKSSTFSVIDLTFKVTSLDCRLIYDILKKFRHLYFGTVVFGKFYFVFYLFLSLFIWIEVTRRRVIVSHTLYTLVSGPFLHPLLPLSFYYRFYYYQFLKNQLLLIFGCQRSSNCLGHFSCFC